MAKLPEEKCRRRLYSLYPEQIAKLQKLAAHSSSNQSEYLRELIDVDYARKFPRGEVREPIRYGQID